MRKMLQGCALLLGLLVCAMDPNSANGQSVQQSGSVTPSHSVRWVANGVVGDGGTASNPLLSSIGTAGSGPTICASSATTGALNRVCLSSTATGGGITMNNIGGGTGGFTFTLNGVVQGIATVTLPVTANDGACFADNTGTLRDCGGVPIVTTCATAGAFPVWDGAVWACSTVTTLTNIKFGSPLYYDNTGAFIDRSAKLTINNDLGAALIPGTPSNMWNAIACRGDNTNLYGCIGIFTLVGDRAGVVAGTKGLIYGIAINIAPIVARDNSPFDDAAGLVVTNSGIAKATDAIYVGNNSGIVGAQWVTGVLVQTVADYAYRSLGTFGYGFETAGATFTGHPIRLGNNTSLASRNFANAADVSVAKLNASDQVQLGAPTVIVTGAATNIILGQLTLATMFNALSLNGTTTPASMIGFAAGNGVSNNLFYYAPSGGLHTFRINNVDIISLPTAAGTSGQPMLSSGSGATAMTFGTLGPTGGGTGFSSYTAGDILYADTTTSLAKLIDAATGNALISGGAGVAPSWGKITSSHLNISTTSCTNQFVTAISAGAVGTCTTATLASAQYANQGTTTTVLHGNASGNPSFAAVSLTADISGTLGAANGGTGVANNASSTITISGNFATTFVVAGANSYTFPNASDTVVMLTQSQTLTNKTETSPVLNGSITSVGTAALTWIQGRDSAGAGNNFTIQAGGAKSTATDTLGGNLILSAGIATGNAPTLDTGNYVAFYTPITNTGAGTSDRTPVEQMRVMNYGSTGGAISFTGTSTSATNYAFFGAFDGSTNLFNAGTNVLIRINNSTIVTVGSAALAVSVATDATTTSSGAIQNPGGMSVNKRVFMNGITTSAGLQTAVICQSSAGELIADSVACLASAERFKNVHAVLSSSEIAVMSDKFAVKSWTYKREPDSIFPDRYYRERIGLTADDVAAIDPRLVEFDSDGDVRTIDYNGIISLLAARVRDLGREIDRLKASK